MDIEYLKKSNSKDLKKKLINILKSYSKKNNISNNYFLLLNNKFNDDLEGNLRNMILFSLDNDDKNFFNYLCDSIKIFNYSFSEVSNYLMICEISGNLDDYYFFKTLNENLINIKDFSKNILSFLASNKECSINIFKHLYELGFKKSKNPFERESDAEIIKIRRSLNNIEENLDNVVKKL